MACREHLARLCEQQDRIDRLGALVLAITFEPPAAIEKFSRHERLPYSVLSDSDRRLYAAFGLTRQRLARLLRPSALAAYLRGLGHGRWPRIPRGDLEQLGGDVALDRQGRVVFVHRSRDVADRPPVEAILAAVEAASTPS